jgi:hypothetical protein
MSSNEEVAATNGAIKPIPDIDDATTRRDQLRTRLRRAAQQGERLCVVTRNGSFFVGYCAGASKSHMTVESAGSRLTVLRLDDVDEVTVVLRRQPAAAARELTDRQLRAQVLADVAREGPPPEDAA